MHSSAKPFVVAALLIAAMPWAVAAETGRTLGDYRFVPVSNIDGPFITTRFSNFTGLAWAGGLNLPLLVIETDPPDTLLALNGNFLFIVAEFRYQHAVHPRVAIALSASGVSRVGTSGQALLSQGVTVLKVIDLGGAVELWRNDRVLLSAVLNVGYVDGLVIDFVKFAEDVIEGNIENAAIINTVDGGTVDGGINAAWALNHWAGITGVAHVGSADVEGLSGELRWRLAAAGTVDFGQRGNAPVGVGLSFDVDHLKPSTVETGTAVGVGLGVHYTGRDDLNLGLELRWSRLPLQGWDTTAYPVSFGLALSYYF